MQCAVKRKRCQSTEFDLEQQHTLFDMSMMKLHQEHMRRGMEPRLMRFVLINNALKLLQMHMLRLEEEDSLGSLDYDGSSNRFFSNTFKHGQPSTSLSPLASPTKTLKLDQSPLLAITPFQMGEECVEEEEGDRTGGGVISTEERRPSNGLVAVNSLATVNQSCSSSHVGKHSSSSSSSVDAGQQESQTPPTKKPCHEQGVSTAILDHISLEPAANLDLTPSEDFAKVDPAMYDYDVPNGPSTTSTSSSSSSRPCTMKTIGTPVVQNGDSGSYTEEGSESSQDTSAESDFLDELDHIVNLLMT